MDLPVNWRVSSEQTFQKQDEKEIMALSQRRVVYHMLGKLPASQPCQATFRASDMKAISDFGLHQQMVFAHILTELAPVICSDHEIHLHTSHT